MSPPSSPGRASSSDSNTELEKLLASQPEAIQDEIIRINTEARPFALQVALLIPILAGLLGLLNSFRMCACQAPRHQPPSKAPTRGRGGAG